MSYEIEVKCHWWSGYDLLRRLLFFIVYTLFENFSNDYTQVCYVMHELLMDIASWLASKVHEIN